MKKIFIATCLLTSLCACKNKQTTTSTEEKIVASAPQNSSHDLIRNNIDISATGGVKVEQAFMMNQNGSLLANDNHIAIGQAVELRVLTSGWTDSSGLLSLGASEKITTNDNTVALDANDIFEKQPAIKAEPQQMIRLQATISKQDIAYQYYEVKFKVWNKSANQYIDGRYKLYIK